MKTLHLNLHKKWFDMTASGEKTEDYREVTPYWVRRLVEATDMDVTVSDVIYYLNGGEYDPFKSQYFRMKKFDTTTLSNGYSKNRPQFVVEFKGIEIREGRPEWGAEPGKKYFVIKHGKKI